MIIDMNDYVINSYVGVNEFTFGLNRNRVHEMLGKPERERKSMFTEEITDFWKDSGLQLTFSSSQGNLKEISLYPNIGNAFINGLELFSQPSPNVFSELVKQDKSVKESEGIIVFFKLGIAVTGFGNEDDNKSVTAFSHGCWDINDPDLRAYG